MTPENTRLKLLISREERFIDIRENDVVIKDPYKGRDFTVEDYILLYSSTGGFKSGDDITFLGINSTIKKVRSTTQQSESRKSFWLKNSELFAILCALICSWAKSDEERAKLSLPISEAEFLPEQWLGILDPTIMTVEPANNWYGFVLNLHRIKDSLPEGLREIVERCKQHGFTLNLLAENGLGNDASPNIFIQISSDSMSQRFIQSGEPVFVNYHSLTLERTNFRQAFVQSPEKLFRHFETKYSITSLQSLVTPYQEKFEKAVSNFLKLYELMEKLPLRQFSYQAIILDLYDRNRNVSSVDLDIRLKRLIQKTVRDSEKGVKNSYDWAAIISSVIINHAEDLQERVRNNPKDITEFFSKKRVIEKMERIYDAVLKRKEPLIELSKYIGKQVESWEAVQPVVW